MFTSHNGVELKTNTSSQINRSVIKQDSQIICRHIKHYGVMTHESSTTPDTTRLIVIVLLSDRVNVAPYWPFQLNLLRPPRYPINEPRQRLQQLVPLLGVCLQATPGGDTANNNV